MAKKTTFTKEKITKATAEKAVKATDMAEGAKAMAFSKTNYILLAIGMAIVVLGFILMSGSSSSTEAYDPDIFSPLRIKIAPMVCLGGFIFIIVAILYHKKDVTTPAVPAEETTE